MSAFSTHESISLDKKVNLPSICVDIKSEDLDNVYEIHRCVEWIRSNNFQKVCLQFPDYLLPHSSEVALRLQGILNQIVYVLGDTAYESCCVDYIAAAHINADAIIHFGPICFSKTALNIPFLNIYEKYELNVGQFEHQFCENFRDSIEEITILVDSPYIHRSDDILLAFNNHQNVVTRRVDEEKLEIQKNNTIIFIGVNERKLVNIELIFLPKVLYYFNGTLQKYEVESRILKRRSYLIEKIRDSNTIGIVIGTVCVKNYLKLIERIKKLISLSGKKYYLISVGKPTVAKLANFPEIDIYVIITCSQSEIYENRDYYKPIATPFDVEVALNVNRNETIQFSYDYNFFLGEDFDSQNLKVENAEKPDVSLISNKIRKITPDEDEEGNASLANQIAIKADGTLVANPDFGAGYLSGRSWKGLEQNLGETEAQLVKEGRSGIAEKYRNEQS